MKTKMVRSELTHTCVIAHALGLVFLQRISWETKHKKYFILAGMKVPSYVELC